MAETKPAADDVQRLAVFFHRNGYVRRINKVRRKKEGRLYKKGNEVRLVASSAGELTEIRRLLKQAGFNLAQPFAKARQWCQPVYGVAEVSRFLSLVGTPRRKRSRKKVVVQRSLKNAKSL
jgi:hypothetical protein